MYILLEFTINNVIVLNKNIHKQIIFIYNNGIAAASVEQWSSSTNAKYAESSSTNYILCEKQMKSINKVSLKNAIVYVICHVFMVDIKI